VAALVMLWTTPGANVSRNAAQLLAATGALQSAGHGRALLTGMQQRVPAR